MTYPEGSVILTQLGVIGNLSAAPSIDWRVCQILRRDRSRDSLS